MTLTVIPQKPVFTGTAPNRLTQAQSVFSANADNMMGYMSTEPDSQNAVTDAMNTLANEVEQIGDNVELIITDATTAATTAAIANATAASASSAYASASSAVNSAASATVAADSAGLATAAANLKGNWSDLTGALNMPASVYHNSTIWALVNDLADVTLREPSVSADWVNASGSIISNLTVTVTGTVAGDYGTINGALAYLSRFTPLASTAGITVTINLLSGFVMKEQVLIKGLNLGWITITGEDAETTVENAYLTTDFTTSDYGFASYPLFGVSKGGTLPRVGQLFKFDVANAGGNKHGVMAVGAGSSADVLPNCGVKQVGGYGVYANKSSTINAESANCSAAGVAGLVAGQGSIINANNATGTTNIATNTVTSNGIIFQ